jgi:oligoribonuclease NrnB/cAMP/cGMP phosphodiesterase (DHH superfamily)
MGLQRIVTHNDFDGLVCAAICSHVYGMENIFFTGPRDIANSRFPIGESDIVCDLPYPLVCGMWFDHHPGNLEDVKLRGIEPADIPGRFSPDPSAARTVYEYFSEERELAPFLADTVAEADIIDSFNYSSIEDWRSPTPGKNVDASLKAPFADQRERRRYLKRVALWMRDNPLTKIETFHEVVQNRELNQAEEEKSLDFIRKSVIFAPEDTDKLVPVIDLTSFRSRPNVIRHMAFLEYPEALAAVVVANPVLDGVKSTNLSISMSLSVLANVRGIGKDIGEIMRGLNIGDGHAGAGAGSVECKGKEAMLRAKDQLVSTVVQTFLDQEVNIRSQESGLDDGY